MRLGLCGEPLKDGHSLGHSWRVGLRCCGDLEVHSRVLNFPSIRSLEVVKNLRVLFVFCFNVEMTWELSRVTGGESESRAME